MIGVDSAGVHADHTRAPNVPSWHSPPPAPGPILYVRGPLGGRRGVHGFHTDPGVDTLVAAAHDRLKSMIYKCINHIAAIPPPQRADDQ